MADQNHNRVLVYSPARVADREVGRGRRRRRAGDGQGEFNHPGALSRVDGAGDVYVADTNNNRIVELSPDGSVLGEWGSRGTADGHFHEPTRRRRRRGRARCTSLDSENNRVQVFDSQWPLPREVGPARHRAGRVLPAERDRGGLRRRRVRRRHEQQPRRALRPGRTRRRRAVWRPGELAAAAGRGAGAAGDASPGTRGVLARRALALGISCKRGCKILVTATLSPAAGEAPCARGGRPQAAARADGARAPARRRRHARGACAGSSAGARTMTARVRASSPPGRPAGGRSVTRTYTVSRLRRRLDGSCEGR